MEPEPVASASSSDSESEQESESGGEASSEAADSAAEAGGAAQDLSEEVLAEAGDAAQDSLEEVLAEAAQDSAEEVLAEAGGAGGEESLESLEQAAGGMPSGAGMPATAEAGLEQQLLDSLGVFDGEMQRTITILASAGAPTDLEGDSGDLASAQGANENLDQTGDGPELVLVNGDLSLLPKAGSSQSGGGPLQSGILVSGDVDGEFNTGGADQSGDVTLMIAAQIPTDIGDGANDDVVARQIREAAMNESDPVLREKLWEEYRRYKKS